MYWIKEIAKVLGVGVGTSNKYCKGVAVTDSGKERLVLRKFYSKTKSKEQQEEALAFARKKICKINKRDLFLIICALYWGEGTKKELNLINGDPNLVLVFVRGLVSLGIAKESIKINVRYYAN